MFHATLSIDTATEQNRKKNYFRMIKLLSEETQSFNRKIEEIGFKIYYENLPESNLVLLMYAAV